MMPLFRHIRQFLLFLLLLPSTHPLTVDTHLHLWPSSSPSPPPSPHSGLPSDYLALASKLSVDHSIVTQPVQLKHDHSFLVDAINAVPVGSKNHLHGVSLFDPLPSPGREVASFASLQSSSSFLGVRFNPTLFNPEDPKDTLSTSPSCLRMYSHLGAPADGPRTNLPKPNGVASLLLMSGFSTYESQVLSLISSSPSTPLVIDHFGFSKVGTKEGDRDFMRLLELIQDTDNVHVRASAAFRMGGTTDEVVTSRLKPLLAARKERVVYGSDYPFVPSAEEWRDRVREEGGEEVMGLNAMGLYNVPEAPGKEERKRRRGEEAV